MRAINYLWRLLNKQMNYLFSSSVSFLMGYFGVFATSLLSLALVFFMDAVLLKVPDEKVLLIISLEISWLSGLRVSELGRLMPLDLSACFFGWFFERRKINAIC